MARVRTSEESKKLSNNECSFLEIKENTDTANAYKTFGCSLGKAFLWEEDYGKKWRLWEGKPTKAERKLTPWI